MLNKYKTHQRILSYLKEKYLANSQDTSDLYSFDAQKIASDINFKISETESALYELRELNLVDFSKVGTKFKISDAGLAKEKTNFYSEKRYDYVVTRLKDLALFTTSILAILSFMITIYKISNDNEENKILKKRIEVLQKRLKSNNKQ